MIPENPTREDLKAAFDESDGAPVDCWENYGDVNPAPHGGQWVNYDPDTGEFRLIGTFHAADFFEDIDPEADAQWVYESRLYFEEIVEENGEFTDDAASTARSLYGANDTPTGLVVDDRFTWFAAAMLDEHRESYDRHGDSVFHGEYSEILEKVGVDPCE